MEVFKTSFYGDTSTLYANRGNGFCEDRTFASGVGIDTRWLGWGVGFLDLDRDGWLDLFLVSGHLRPEVAQVKTETGYRHREVVYRNLGQRDRRPRALHGGRNEAPGMRHGIHGAERRFEGAS